MTLYNPPFFIVSNSSNFLLTKLLNIPRQKMIRKQTMSRLRKILLFLLLVTNRFICFSQVTGKVIDQTNFPLEYATAALYNQETNLLVTGVITDINGVFSFENLKKGTYFIET